MKKMKRLLSFLMVVVIMIYNFGPFMPMMKVFAKEVVDEIEITSPTTSAVVGELPAYTVSTTTAHASVEAFGSNTIWVEWEEGMSSWYAFGAETPTAVTGTTHYGLRVLVELEDGYEFGDDLTIYFNGNDVTENGHTTHMKLDSGGYVFIDLGEAVEENLHTVSFDTDGGSSIDDQMVQDGHLIEFPESPEKNGYVFDGWYADDTFNVVFDFEQPIEDDVTVFAKWLEIVLEADARVATPVEGAHPDVNIVSSDSSMYSVSFTAWYLYESPYPNVSVDDTYVLGNNYALRVSFTPNEGYTFTNDTVFTINGEATSCYGANGNREIIYYNIPAADVVVHTIFNGTGGTYSVQYDTTQEEELEKLGVERNSSGFFVVPAGEEMSLTATPSSGYTFKGWYLTNADQTCSLVEPITCEQLTTNATYTVVPTGYPYYAPVFEEVSSTDTYTVTFNTDGGSIVASQEVESGATATMPVPSPTKDGFSFGGWYADDTLNVEFDFSTPITGDTTIFAKWDEAGETVYTLTYDFNGGSLGGEETYVTSTVSYGMYITAEALVDELGVVAPEGMELEAVTINGTRYELGSAWFVNTDATIVYLWQSSSSETPEYTVTFDSNGGSSIETQTVSENDTATQPTNPTRDGYVFVSWSEGETIINENTGEVDGDSFDFNTPITGNITLVANWAKLYTVRFDTGDVLPDDMKALDQTVMAGEVPNPPTNQYGDVIPDEYENYVIEGFYLDSSYTERYTGEAITSDTTIYAKWIESGTGEITETITEVNLTVNPPKVGTVITMTDEEDWDTLLPQLEVSVPDDASYSLWDEGGEENYAYWVQERSVDCEEAFTGTLVKGEKYYSVVYLLPNEDGVGFDENVTVKVNGEAIDSEFVEVYDDSLIVALEVTPAEEDYNILEGDNQVIDPKNVVDLVVRADGDADKLEAIKVDGNVVDPSMYEITPGSTIVTLKAAYLETLGEGAHTLTFVYEDGEVSSGFTLGAVMNPTPGTNPEPTNPLTYDAIYLWITLLMISILGLSVSSLQFKKIMKK